MPHHTIFRWEEFLLVQLKDFFPLEKRPFGIVGASVVLRSGLS